MTLTLFNINGPAVTLSTFDNGKLDLFKQLSFDAGTLGDPFLCLLEDFAFLQDKVEGNIVGLARLLFKVEAVDQAVVRGHVEFLFRNALSIDVHEFVDLRYRVRSIHVLEDSARVGFVEADLFHDFVGKTGALLEGTKGITETAALGGKDINKFLWVEVNM